MKDEELLHTMTFDEVEEIRKGLQDKLEMALLKNNLGIRIAKVQYIDEKLWINKEYPVEFRLTVMSIVGLDTYAMRRLTNVFNEMRAELESVNNEYKGYKFVF